MASSELWQRIAAARHHARLTMQQLADRAGVSKQSVSAWESADPDRRNMPRHEMIVAISKITGVELSWLVSDSSRVEDLIAKGGGAGSLGAHGEKPMWLSYVAVSRLQPPSQQKVEGKPSAIDSGQLAFKRTWVEYKGFDPACLHSHQVDTDDFAATRGLRRGDTLLVNVEDKDPREGWWIVGDSLKLMRIDVDYLSGAMTLCAPDPCPVPDDLPIVGRVVLQSREI